MALGGIGKAVSGIGKSISKGIGGIGRSLGGLGKKLGGLGKGLSSIAGKFGSLVQKPFSAVKNAFAPLQNSVNQLLDKTPFGNLLKPLANKFFENPLAMLGGGGLGLVGSLAAQGALQPGGLQALTGSLASALGGGSLANALPREGLQNIAQIVAQAQAGRFF